MTESAELPLRVFAPGSLRPVQETIIAGFQAAVEDARVEFAPPAYSGVLAQQILDGAAADVFISANTRHLSDLQAAGLAPFPHPLARNRLSLVSRVNLQPVLSDLFDLARNGLRVVIPPPIDPLGEYAREMLERAGLAEAIARKRVQGEVYEDLASVRSWLVEGEVDAAVIYASMAGSFATQRIMELQPEQDMHERVVFAIGVIEHNGRSYPMAGQFVDWMLAAEGKAVLQQSGFLPLS